jgi:hypothetical protein
MAATREDSESLEGDAEEFLHNLRPLGADSRLDVPCPGTFGLLFEDPGLAAWLFSRRSASAAMLTAISLSWMRSLAFLMSASTFGSRTVRSEPPFTTPFPERVCAQRCYEPVSDGSIQAA